MAPFLLELKGILRSVVVLTTLGMLGLAVLGVGLHWHLEGRLTHTVGVFIVLAELLREGVFYPVEPTVDLVYSAFYHPLAFAPLALLPGSGIEMLPALRCLVAMETIVCFALMAWLLSRAGQRGIMAWQPALWAACTTPLCHSLLGMRDDPRACIFALLAIAAFVRGGRAAPYLAALMLVLAFMTKATAPAAPGLAISYAMFRRDGWLALRRFWVGCAAGTAAVIAILQWGIGCDFLGNGLYYAFVNPAKDPRTWSETLSKLLDDLSGYSVSLAGLHRDHGLPWLLGVSGGALVLQLVRRKLDLWDVLVVACWLKTVVAYRSVGTDLNHLIDLSIYAALHVGVRIGRVLTPTTAIAVFAAMFVLSWPVDKVLPQRGTWSYRNGHTVKAAAVLNALVPVPTLCEEPLLAWTAGVKPLVTDPLLTFAALAPFPEIRKTWFGPLSHPKALQRVVLMRDPSSLTAADRENGKPDPDAWYGPIHFDAEFLREIRTNWEVFGASAGVVGLVRKDPERGQ